ncbi:hypothetical protein P8F81_08025 [Kosakonia cowanii]|uniref:hypothetical protein n=1 Tax=Kosakonia cowanii TaxID=208223 RepID=UPI002DDD5CEF|nr:hypothetical protein [Kosakonia cowanii]WRY60929.1 hypothetical protein P8F81_08025 [Kosakonia cowanii]
MKLTAAQKKFIQALQSGKTPSRDVNDKTGKALANLGLAKFAVMVGWIATKEGFAINIDKQEVV